MPNAPSDWAHNTVFALEKNRELISCSEKVAFYLNRTGDLFIEHKVLVKRSSH